MVAARIRLFSLLRIPVYVDATWLLLAAYLTVSLATRYFPVEIPGVPVTLAITLGIAATLGLMVSITLHELAHALAARRFGVAVSGITLFIFGGVAEMRKEPNTPRADFWIALLGPCASVAVALACMGAAVGARTAHQQPVEAVFAFLALANTVLALFNLIPAFPLDGGRILRAIIWWQTGSYRRATRIAAILGSVFGVILIVTGLLRMLSGDVVGGTWQGLIGFFIAIAAWETRQQIGVPDSLKGATAEDIMDRGPVLIPREVSAQEAIETRMLPRKAQFAITAENGKPVGYLLATDIRHIPMASRAATPVSAIDRPLTPAVAVRSADKAETVVRKIEGNGIGYLAVFDDETVAGTISAASLAAYIDVREALT
jgi:Zn-dependent protease